MSDFVLSPEVAWLEAHERPSWQHGFHMPRGLARIKEDHAEGGFCTTCKQSAEVIVIEPDD
jgi:hypothetical protein